MLNNFEIAILGYDFLKITNAIIMGTIYVGILFIAIGILIRIFPNLLAGYNQLSQRERENSISNGLPTFAFIVFCLMGIILIAGHFAAIGLNKPSLSGSINISVILIGAVVLIVFGKILTNKRVKKTE
ncbi:hypothetical protein J2X69_000611 [Algoriphagus sp. 4150]|uniref:DUF3784 domain-containing protein n=1 Tax=Algoriphagus sp. 4150 TaxID=2817756 RepID=UPI0028551013|nr:DUF3784 domain-containing protein [Algoriphagus sp. 4150]MDR7128283.1 hypothetical protein [Algoriphagus sp. 4150]